MPCDLPLRCSCGATRWLARGISPSSGNHLVCYCDDCQSFAHFLGGAEKILDPYGGSDIFQMSPARLEFSEGADQLACVRLTPGGMVRWYTDCCRTPIGNTLATGKVPFVGMILPFAGAETDPAVRADAIGAIRSRVHARFAKGDRARLDALGERAAYDKAPASLIARFARILFVARLRGDHHRSPFFDPQSGRLRVRPHVLSAEELHGVERARDAG